MLRSFLSFSGIFPKGQSEDQIDFESSGRFGVDENLERGNWALKADYLLSVVGYTVGLGNIWRFPFLLHKNGGGAFLIPYLIMLSLAGLPMFFMESSLGQFSSLGPGQVWKAVPILQGLGIIMFVASTFQGIYYNCIISYCMFYLFVSFRNPLPWSDCLSWSNANETCYTIPKDPACTFGFASGGQGTSDDCKKNATYQSRSEHYWDVVVLRRSGSINETGGIVWHLALCLFLSWSIVLVVLCKGIKFSGKVVYFAVTFPYVALILLLIRGLTLEGAFEGIEFYIGKRSNFSKLAEPEVWKDAASQILYSLSVSMGGVTALSSYNKFHNDCYSDTIVVGVFNSFTSLLIGFVIFSTLGHMAYADQLPVSEISQSETLVTSIQDEFPTLLRKKRTQLVAVVCFVLYVLGLLLVTEAGIYWINLLDHYCSGWSLILIAVLELIALCIYGLNTFIKDIEMMIGRKHWLFWMWWRLCWLIVTPGLLTTILIWSIIITEEPAYGKIEYPTWAIVLGWLIIVFYFMWVPIIAVLVIVYSKGDNMCKKVIAGLKPAPDWGPFLLKHRGARYEDQIDPEERIKCGNLPTISSSHYS
ncbi:sodium- and chloride-dependent neutral and basic amino acid transporter B(0+)-like isoform X2 [Scyliorhinus canicula]|uniref:sodium- and chloride-dependent neutral and basic amino acid transporter B(0+)-like isoform X2 n=1 Tax=Scyliorhinus canicula TaxID=7830 RepID=UPI0018F5B77A|nr:sodium- and chloride-dependent neutral and basic amino acid transporter B(0+)-like isoform X2 [Scyliorhinus canicula]